eukprot:scaffold1265_cov366-Prasinococcus_capsulatus_cf.AAC.2
MSTAAKTKASPDRESPGANRAKFSQVANSVRRQKKFANLIGGLSGVSKDENAHGSNTKKAATGKPPEAQRAGTAEGSSKVPAKTSQRDDKASQARAAVVNPADLKDAAFGPENLLEKLMRMSSPGIDATSGKPLEHTASNDAKVYNGFPGAKEMLDVITSAQVDLDRIKKNVASRVRTLEKELRAEETSKDEELDALEEHSKSLFESFHRLDGRVTRVGHTAARIGDRLERADAQRQQAKEAINTLENLIAFGRATSGKDMAALPPLFANENNVAEAAPEAQKLKAFAEALANSVELSKGDPTVTTLGGDSDPEAENILKLDRALVNLQEYCNDLENRLLNRFDQASDARDRETMAACAKTLIEFNGGASLMQRYVATRPMFIDPDVMATDIKTATKDDSGIGLKTLYRKIVSTMNVEARQIAEVFPSPTDVMQLFVQRVLEQRVQLVLDHVMQAIHYGESSVDNGVDNDDVADATKYVRTVATCYQYTEELAKELKALGCGDLDVVGIAQSLFADTREQQGNAEINCLLLTFAEEKQESHRANPGSETDELAGLIDNKVLHNFMRASSEAAGRVKLVQSDPAARASVAQRMVEVLCQETSNYLQEALVVRRARVEAASQTGDNEYFMGAIKGYLLSIRETGEAMQSLRDHIVSSLAPLLTEQSQEASFCGKVLLEAVNSTEKAVGQGLLLLVEAFQRVLHAILISQQLEEDFLPQDEELALMASGPTAACAASVKLIRQVWAAVQSAVEGANLKHVAAALGVVIDAELRLHISSFAFNSTGALRLKRDVSEYVDATRILKDQTVDVSLQQLSSVTNVLLVAPESLVELVSELEAGGLSRQEVMALIQRREDYKSSKIASLFVGAGA